MKKRFKIYREAALAEIKIQLQRHRLEATEISTLLKFNIRPKHKRKLNIKRS